MDKPAVTASRFADLLNAPPNTSAAWDAFSLFVIRATPAQATGAFANHALGLYLSGRHRIRREMVGRPVEGWSDPGTVNLTPPNVEATWQASGPSRAIVLLIPDALRQLGELAGISTRHFERAFRQAIGVPPHAYVVRKRVARAQNLLLSEPGLTIDEIAVRAGFSSSSHLSSTFRRQTGSSPTAFRRLQSR